MSTLITNDACPDRKRHAGDDAETQEEHTKLQSPAKRYKLRSLQTLEYSNASLDSCVSESMRSGASSPAFATLSTVWSPSNSDSTSPSDTDDHKSAVVEHDQVTDSESDSDADTSDVDSNTTATTNPAVKDTSAQHMVTSLLSLRDAVCSSLESRPGAPKYSTRWRFYAPIPGTLLHKYSSVPNPFDRNDLFNLSYLKSSAGSAATKKRELKCVGQGSTFDAKAARVCFPQLCKKHQRWYVPYLTAAEYERLELVLAMLELVLRQYASSTDVMGNEAVMHLVDLVYMAVGYNRYNVCRLSNDDDTTNSSSSGSGWSRPYRREWWTDAKFLQNYQRMQRFVWSRGIGVLEELLLEMPRMFLARSCGQLAIAALRIRNYTKRESNDGLQRPPKLSPMSVHVRVLHQNLKFDPLLQLFAKCDADPMLPFRCQELRRDLTLASELLRFACTSMLDMALDTSTASVFSSSSTTVVGTSDDTKFSNNNNPTLVVSNRSDLIEVLEDRPDVMRYYIEWLGKLATRRDIQVHVLFSDLFFTGEEYKATHGRKIDRWTGSLQALLTDLYIPPVCFVDLLTHGLDQSTSFGAKMYRLYACVFPHFRFSTVWEFIDTLRRVNPDSMRTLELACSQVLQKVRRGSVTSVNRDAIRHLLAHSDIVDQCAHQDLAAVVMSQFDGTCPSWGVMPHMRTILDQEQDAWRIDDLYLALRYQTAPIEIDPIVTERIRELWVTWIEPDAYHWHICIGQVDESLSTCACTERLNELYGMMTYFEHMYPTLRDDINDDDDDDMVRELEENNDILPLIPETKINDTAGDYYAVDSLEYLPLPASDAPPLPSVDFGALLDADDTMIGDTSTGNEVESHWYATARLDTDMF